MQIILEDKITTIDQLKYVPVASESGIDDSIAFTGWNIDGWKAETKEHYYPVYNETYSQYVFTVQISRIPFNSFLKTFLPVFFILLLCFLPLLWTRINSNPTYCHDIQLNCCCHVPYFNIQPDTSCCYLTFADRFMVLTYFILLASSSLILHY